MEQSYYWNAYEEYHPRNRLLKYLKPSKICEANLQILLQLRKMYRKLPPIVYNLQEKAENEDIVLEYDIFGQQYNLPLTNTEAIWQPTSFYVSDRIYERIKHDLQLSKTDKDYTFFCLFPIYVDMNRKNQLLTDHQNEKIFFPSTAPVTQYDLNQLQERFDKMLYKEKALEIGLCRKRRRIYNDLFDELIRITTLQCSERGFLLGRIKNEYVHWINTYEELYSSGMAFAMRQYLYKTEEKEKHEYMIRELENNCQRLRNEIEKETIRFEKLSQLINDDTDNEQNSKQNALKANVNTLRWTNEILRCDLQNALENILSSTIFLGEPIDYDKETN